MAFAFLTADKNYLIKAQFPLVFLFVIPLVDLIMDSQITEVIGWLGFALVSIGYYLNARKKLYCFIVWGIGNAVYILYGFIINAFPIIAMSIFVLGMNIYGYLNWVKDS